MGLFGADRNFFLTTAFVESGTSSPFWVLRFPVIPESIKIVTESVV